MAASGAASTPQAAARSPNVAKNPLSATRLTAFERPTFIAEVPETSPWVEKSTDVAWRVESHLSTVYQLMPIARAASSAVAAEGAI
jgi:hypothetical protein